MAEPNASGEPADQGAAKERLREMMVGYQNADPEAAERLVMFLSPMLLRFLTRPGYPPGYAEDLLQECWLRIHKSRHTYRPDAPVMPWIYGIARHTRQDGYRRRARKEGREVPLEDLRHALPAPDRSPRSGELLRLVDELPDTEREVIFMLKVSGMSLEDVARATSSTVGAVKQKAHRAYVRLRKMAEISLAFEKRT